MNTSYSQANFFRVSLMAAAIASSPIQAATNQSPIGTLEEVVVTAEHRKASLQDTEIALTAITSDTLKDLGISNGSDLGQIVPNLHINPMGGTALGFSPIIRGVGQSEVYVTYDPAVGIYIDDVLIPKNPGGLIDVLDMERVEVLRGPQGTLYGRNTIAGAMNFVTKKPTDEVEGSVRVTLGDYAQKDFRGVLNLPLVPASSKLGALNMRISAASLNRDGFMENDLPGAPIKDFGDKDRDVAMVQLQWEPTDIIQLRYSYDRTRIDESPVLQRITTINFNSFVGPLVAPYSQQQDKYPDSVLTNDDNQAELEVDGHSLQISYELSETMTLRSITGYREMESGGYNAGSTPFPVVNTSDSQNFESFTQEFRLTGNSLDERLNYSLGAFYMAEEGDVNFRLEVFGGTVNDTYGEFENKNWALYGQATYYLTEQWSVTGGIRYTEEEREMTKSEALSPATIYPKASRDFENVSPMVSLGYDWDDNTNSYFKISSGYQSGGFNVRDLDPNQFQRGFDDETLIAYELGLKTTSDDQRIRTNVAVFFSDYDDKRVNNFIPEIASNVIRNAGVVEIYGLELELLANITANLQWGLDYGYTKAEYKKYDSANPDFDPSCTTDCEPEIIDLSGVTNFPYTPESKVHTFIGYSFSDFGVGILNARVDYTYREGINFLGAQPERNSGRSVGLWDARISMDEIATAYDTTLRVSAWVKNLTDESYWVTGANIYDTFGFDINNYGEPRTYGVDVELAF